MQNSITINYPKRLNMAQLMIKHIMLDRILKKMEHLSKNIELAIQIQVFIAIKMFVINFQKNRIIF